MPEKASVVSHAARLVRPDASLRSA